MAADVDRNPAGRNGLGWLWAPSKRKNSPSNRAPSGPPSAHRARSTSMLSSARRPRLAKSAPQASSSSRIHPTPTHSRTRPPESRSRVASRLASTTGWWAGSTSTPVASPIRLVPPATKARRSRGSGTAQSSGSGIRPDVEYGYRLAVPVMTRGCSTTTSDS